MSKIANFETAPIEWDPTNVATCQIEFTQRERDSHSNIGEGRGGSAEHWTLGNGSPVQCPALIVIRGHRSLEDAGQLMDINYTHPANQPSLTNCQATSPRSGQLKFN